MVFRYSMIDSFLTCPKCFYDRYVLGKEDKTRSSAIEYGQAMHAAIRAHFEGGNAIEVFNLYWNSLKDVDMKVYRYSWQELGDLANNRFLPNFIKLHASHFTDCKMEETLEMQLGPYKIQGTFDMCGDYKGVLTLSDWKTSIYDYKASKVSRNHQLYVYCMLYAAHYGVLPKQVMYKTFVKSKGSIQTTIASVTDEIITRHKANILAILQNMFALMETKQIYSNYNCYRETCLNE